VSPERTTTFQIRESATSPANWDNVDPCYTSTDFDYTDGGHVGFTCGRNYIDDFNVQRWDGDS